MILYKNKHFITRSDAPDTDFMGDADFVIPDDSELAEKVISLYPNFEIVTHKGSVTDVIEIEPVVTPEQLEARKENRIQESKLMLSKWLNDNPLLYTDGNYYSCTEEKQSLLNSNLASYERSIAGGFDYQLRWNSTGCECVPWNYDSLRALSLTIAAYVAPKISIQQAIEIQIRSCTTLEEVNSVEISYD